MKLPRVNFIGCGRLGKTIAKLLLIHNKAIISGIVNSTVASTKETIHFIGQGIACTTIKELPEADVYFITTGDDDIHAMSETLIESNILRPNAIVVHCSGSLSSDMLSKVNLLNCYKISIHPIKSFANPETSVKSFPGTYCAIEGDNEAIPMIKNIFESIGGIVFSIDKTNKKRYHAAGVIANNYLVTLHYHAVQCYKASGVDETIAKKMVSMLMTDALANLAKSNHEESLTGPIQRGDTQTIKEQVTSLSDNELAQSIYSALGLGTLPLTHHSEEKKSELREVLSRVVSGNRCIFE